MYNTHTRIEELSKENAELRKKIGEVVHKDQEHRYAELRRNRIMKQELEVAQQEAEKFQAINDELIERLIHVANNQVNNQELNQYKMALEFKNKALVEQAKYTAELRSYVDTLQEKLQVANADRKHLEARANELSQKLGYELMNNRVNELYDALVKIEEIVSEAI